MRIDVSDIEGLTFKNISGEVHIKQHDSPDIEIICNQENQLHMQEHDGLLEITYNKHETETIKKKFVEKIFKKSFQLNLPINSSFVDDRDMITIYHLLMTEINIFVPKSLIQNIYIDGNVTLFGNDFSNLLRIHTSGNNTIKIQNISNVYIESQGKVECHLKDILNTTIYSNGGCYAKLSGRYLHSVRLKTKGDLDMDIVGSVNDLNCDCSGMSNVMVVGKVENKKIKRKGICKISITN